MDVSIVIINYNSHRHTVNCISSIIENTNEKIAYEIIVVDNNSAADDLAMLKESLSEMSTGCIRVFESTKNTGFALGNMLGVNFASGKYLFLLNNDCSLMNDAVAELFGYMESQPSISLAVPQCHDRNGNHVAAFDYFPTVANQWLGAGLCRLLKPESYPQRKRIYEQPISVPMVSGSAMFFRREMFNAVGGLDTNYFLYCEEEDVCLRLSRIGGGIVHVPMAKVLHVGGGSTHRNAEIEKEFYISLFYFLSKNYGWAAASAIKFRYVIKEALKAFKNKKRLSILWFLLKRPHLGKSMRHRQVCKTT